MAASPMGAVTPPILDAAYAASSPDQLLQEVAWLLLPPSDGVDLTPPNRQLTYRQVREYAAHIRELNVS